MSSNLSLFLAYRIFSRMYFHLPILFLLFWSMHLTYLTATLLLAAYSAASTIASDFASKLSKWWPVSNVVILGEAMKVFGLIMLVVGTTPGDASLPALFLGQLIGGAGFALALSADGSLLRQVAVNTDGKALGAIQAKAQSWMFIATLLAGFAGGVLYDHQPHWSLYAGIGATFIAMLVVVIIAFRLNEIFVLNKSYKEATGSMEDKGLVLDRMQAIWVSFYAITRAFALAPFIGLLPLYFALQQVDPYLFGIVLGLFTLGGFVVALYGGPILASIGLKGTLVSFLGIIISLGVFASSDLLEAFGISYFSSSLVAITMLGIAAGAIRPSVMSCMDLSNLSDIHKMMVFSRMERIFGYLCASLLIFFGFLVENFSITATFGITIVTLFVILAANAVWLHLSYPSTLKDAQTSI